jgi:hypothetical protein
MRCQTVLVYPVSKKGAIVLDRKPFYDGTGAIPVRFAPLIVDTSMNLVLNLCPLLILIGLAWLVSRLGARAQNKQATRMATSRPPVENLVPLVAYDVDETGYWRRLPWVTGLLFGVGFAALELLLPIPNQRYTRLITAAMSFALGGPLFGLFFPVLLRRRVRQITAGLYAGESWIIDPPPANRLFYYQIPCTWIQENRGIGGVLYLGRQGFLFLPHKQNRRPGPPLEMTPIEAMRIARGVPFTGNAIQRLFIARPQEQVEITWNGASARFLMPNSTDTMLKMGRCLDALQGIPK